MHCEMISRSPRRFEASLSSPAVRIKKICQTGNPSCAALVQTGAAESFQMALPLGLDTVAVSQNRAPLDVRLTTEDVSEFDRWFLPRPSKRPLLVI
jgi:hypothetical protein